MGPKRIRRDLNVPRRPPARSTGSDTLVDRTAAGAPSNAWLLLWGWFCVVIVAQTVVVSDGPFGRLKPFHLAAIACTLCALLLLPREWKRFNPATTVFWSLALVWSALMTFVSMRSSLGPEGIQQLVLVFLAIGPALIFRYLVKAGTRRQLIALQCSPLLGVIGLGYTIEANSERTQVGVLDALSAILRGNPTYVTTVVYRRGLLIPGNSEIVRANIRHLIFVALAVLVWTTIYAFAEARRRDIRLSPWLTGISVGLASILIATSTSRSSILILVLPLVGLLGRVFVVRRTTLGGNKVIAALIVTASAAAIFFSSFLEGSLVGRVFSDTKSYQERLDRIRIAIRSASQASLLEPAPPFPSPHNLILGSIGRYGWIAGAVSVALVVALLWGFGRAELRYIRRGNLINIAVAGLYSAAVVRAFTSGDNGLSLDGIMAVLIATLVVTPTTNRPNPRQAAVLASGKRVAPRKPKERATPARDGVKPMRANGAQPSPDGRRSGRELPRPRPGDQTAPLPPPVNVFAVQPTPPTTPVNGSTGTKASASGVRASATNRSMTNNGSTINNGTVRRPRTGPRPQRPDRFSAPKTRRRKR